MVAIEEKTRTQNRLVTLVILALMLLGIVLIVADWRETRQVLQAANWRYIPLVLLFTALSYGFYSYAYAVVARTLGIGMRKRELAEVCFISSVVNHVLTTGGVVGYSLRYLLMKLYNVSLKDVLTSSILHYYLTSLDMLIILPISILYLLQHSTIPHALVVGLGVLTALWGIILVVSTILVVFPSRRRPMLALIEHYGRKVLRREWRQWLIQFDQTLSYGTEAFKRSPVRLLWVMLLTLADFTCSIIAIEYVFKALGPAVKAPALVSGYVIGIMVGLVSMIPGGLGVQEGSMASIYALMGISFRQAALAAVLFRILYYFLPYLLILPSYNRLISKMKQHPVE